MSTWKITPVKKIPKLNDPIFIEGLPGIGNVGKVVTDFLIDEFQAKKLYDIFSFTFPHSVFVNENNLIELPNISIYYKKFDGKKRDLLFLAGDIQPVDEISSYEFTDKVLDIIQRLNCKEIITLGGIGLNDIPKEPKVYCTANTKKIIQKYHKSAALNNNLYGVVGPIVGVSGLLLGLAEKRKINAISFLAETYGHPLYLGVKGAKEILKILSENLRLTLDIESLDCDIQENESDILKKTKELSDVSKKTALRKIKSKLDYIG